METPSPGSIHCLVSQKPLGAQTHICAHPSGASDTFAFAPTAPEDPPRPGFKASLEDGAGKDQSAQVPWQVQGLGELSSSLSPPGMCLSQKRSQENLRPNVLYVNSTAPRES